MTVSWTPHRFSGGVLALDVANTVVWRGDAARSLDRFDDIAEIGRFAEAAAQHRASELSMRRLTVANACAVAPTVIVIREAIDRLFRQTALEGVYDASALAELLDGCADGMRQAKVRLPARGTPLADSTAPIAFEAALAISALSLLPAERASRIRICANCRWLFLDESRNRSRVWCDMSVCGNRQKAKRHYHRTRIREVGDD